MPDQVAGERRPVRLGRLYILAVAVAGGVVLADSLLAVASGRAGYGWLVLAILTWVGGSFAIKVPGVQATIHISETFVFALILLFGYAPAAVTVAFDGLLISLRRRTRDVNWYLFNVAGPAVCIWIASRLFFLVSGIQPFASVGGAARLPLASLLLPVLGMGGSYFLLNSWLRALAVASETGTPPYRVWRTQFLWLGLSTIVGASLGLLLTHLVPPETVRDLHGFASLRDWEPLGIVVPLLLVLYLTFRISVLRVEDANKHLSELNELYLSTVETLAMAIDAKDQVTHGHIRRVQAYAVGLARRLGISDEMQIKAIEAAALLHDMGKLSVPEFILNKPGKLTSAEYERMKLHAPVGASILSQINFPYPVVPIVRHHHESWDGTGYPDGIAGEDIPIGARIMAVVDCYDALTSDRPYRAAMSDDQALAIIMARRGTMYDPGVVDAFLRVYRELRPAEQADEAHPHALIHMPRAQTQAPYESDGQDQGGEVGSAVEEILLLCDLAENLGGRTTLDDVADVMARRLRRMVPAPLVVFYLQEEATGDLVARHASGFGGRRLSGLRIPLGNGLSGWVAANRRTIINSNPALDLGGRIESLAPRPESALSTPLVHENQLVGVLTLYAARRDAFTEDHRRVVDLVARQIAGALSRSTTFEHDRALTLRDGLTGLPNATYLDHLLASPGFADVPPRLAFGVLCFAVDSASAGADATSRDALLLRVANATRSVLRTSDLVFRYSDDQLVILMPEAGPTATRRIAQRIVERLVDGTPPAGDLPILVGLAFAPADGRSIDDLLRKARERLARQQWADVLDATPCCTEGAPGQS